MKKWFDAAVVELNISETAKGSHGNGNTAGGPDCGGKGNGKKGNRNWTEAQKDGNTTFWGPVDLAPYGDNGYNGVNGNS